MICPDTAGGLCLPLAVIVLLWPRFMPFGPRCLSWTQTPKRRSSSPCVELIFPVNPPSSHQALPVQQSDSHRIDSILRPVKSPHVLPSLRPVPNGSASVR